VIVVTGGAGFIGSNLIAGLEASGRTGLVVCDRLGTDEKWRNIAKRELADLVPPERLFDAIENRAGEIEIIFHMGAISSTTERDADAIIENNFALSRRLWQWCADRGVRLVYASSAATYGSGESGFEDSQSMNALARLRPLNAYGWSKHLFDRKVARTVVSNERMPPQWSGLKFFNVYGPNEYHKGDMMSVVAKLYPRIMENEPARLFKSYRPEFPDGGQERDFIWVGDCVRVMLWLLDNPDVSGLFNVGTGRARSFADLARATFTAAGLEPNIEYIEMPESLRPKYQYFTQADTTKLRGAGFSAPFTELEQGIAVYVREFLAAADPYL
jgi:ADP-L-glycero-D-manno-heptose 6-epimerase